jgi:hypothetical protein
LFVGCLLRLNWGRMIVESSLTHTLRRSGWVGIYEMNRASVYRWAIICMRLSIYIHARAYTEVGDCLQGFKHILLHFFGRNRYDNSKNVCCVEKNVDVYQSYPGYVQARHNQRCQTRGKGKSQPSRSSSVDLRERRRRLPKQICQTEAKCESQPSRRCRAIVKKQRRRNLKSRKRTRIHRSSKKDEGLGSRNPSCRSISSSR